MYELRCPSARWDSQVESSNKYENLSLVSTNTPLSRGNHHLPKNQLNVWLPTGISVCRLGSYNIIIAQVTYLGKPVQKKLRKLL